MVDQPLTPPVEEAASSSSSSSFVWDPLPCSNLYFHASTGFYHDPVAGWYYSSRDSSYYTFQNGIYAPLQSYDKDEKPQLNVNPPQEDNSVGLEEACVCGENDLQPYSRPSEWLDEVLINEYLSGYRNAGADTDDQFTDSYSQTATHVGEEGEINEKLLNETLCDYVSDSKENDTVPQNASQTEGMFSADEEVWMSQYGQVNRSDTDVEAVDLWDWELVEDRCGKGHSRKIARLTGRLVGPSSRMHPSLPSSGGMLKTTAIRQVHLDLVLVASGKVYRLRMPSKSYLGKLSAYDSSNPTKDWAFPPLSPSSLSRFSAPLALFDDSSKEEKEGKEGCTYRYRDRAAERRQLHGANGIAPAQKHLLDVDGHIITGCESDDGDLMVAQEEARQLSFGTQSYGSKIMQSMGWKQGEALGSSRKGIVEPLEATGNKGTAGLGWNRK